MSVDNIDTRITNLQRSVLHDPDGMARLREKYTDEQIENALIELTLAESPQSYEAVLEHLR